METQEFDLVVIGSGPAGEKGAAQAAYFGKSVAVIEREPMVGGAAANTGTLPSKTLRESALFLSGFRNRELSGLNLSVKHQVTIRDFMVHEQHVCADERLRILSNLARHKIQLFQGNAVFVDPHTVVVRKRDGSEARLRGEIVLIAVGSSPFRPAVFPFEDVRIYDSDEILTLDSMPSSMLIIGGGVIGCEYACMFAILGIDVTVVEQRGRIIGSLDGEVAASLQSQMEALGVKFHFNDTVDAVDTKADEVEVRLKSGRTLRSKTILVSSGRGGNTRELGLEAVGLRPDKRGYIQVDQDYRTEVPHIFAAGDVVGSPALASTAMEQARLAMVKAFNLQYKSEIAHILPYGIYTIPECSMAGDTEESLEEQKIPYVAGKATYASNARGHIIGDARGFLKLLFRRDDMRLLGVHVIGEQATELVHVGLTAILSKQGADLFIQTCFNYPTLTELYKYATYDALGNRARLQKSAEERPA